MMMSNAKVTVFAERMDVPASITRMAWSPAEVARTTGLSLGFIRKEIAKGALLATRCGRRLLVPDAELQRYLAQGSRKPELELVS
jgi:excisionase family DNA binding protein